jgi:hypothetical protein
LGVKTWCIGSSSWPLLRCPNASPERPGRFRGLSAAKRWRICTCRYTQRDETPRRTRNLKDDLRIPDSVFTEETLRGLIRDLVVPALVARYIRERRCASKGEHNGGQPL